MSGGLQCGVETGGSAARAVTGPGHVEPLCGSVVNATPSFGIVLAVEGERVGMAQRRRGTVIAEPKTAARPS